jgi:hypothetical protein
MNLHIVAIVAAVLLYIVVLRPYLSEGYRDDAQYHLWEQHPGGYSRESHVEQGDLNLSSMYRQIHLLERLARERVALNNNGPGGDKGVPRERLILERIAKDSDRLAKNIRDLIAAYSRKPAMPTHYATNPMLGLPSQVGNVPWYMEGN